jgi:hypothetical protein
VVWVRPSSAVSAPRGRTTAGNARIALPFSAVGYCCVGEFGKSGSGISSSPASRSIWDIAGAEVLTITKSHGFHELRDRTGHESAPQYLDLAIASSWGYLGGLPRGRMDRHDDLEARPVLVRSRIPAQGSRSIPSRVGSSVSPFPDPP